MLERRGGKGGKNMKQRGKEPFPLVSSFFLLLSSQISQICCPHVLFGLIMCHCNPISMAFCLWNRSHCDHQRHPVTKPHGHLAFLSCKICHQLLTLLPTSCLLKHPFPWFPWNHVLFILCLLFSHSFISFSLFSFETVYSLKHLYIHCSFLGPQLFLLFIHSVGNITYFCGFDDHFYTDNPPNLAL